jgi:hypothetical protein
MATLKKLRLSGLAACAGPAKEPAACAEPVDGPLPRATSRRLQTTEVIDRLLDFHAWVGGFGAFDG